MKHSLFILILFSLVTASCTPLSKIGNNNLSIEKLGKNDFKKLNGIYVNNFDTIYGKINRFPEAGFSEYKRLTILYQLSKRLEDASWRDNNNKIIEANEKRIRIEFETNKLATISVFQMDTLIASKKVHGKFKNGYFYLRPKFYIIPLVPLIFGYNFERARIGISSGSLLIDYTVNKWGFALVAGSSEKGFISTLYKKQYSMNIQTNSRFSKNFSFSTL